MSTNSLLPPCPLPSCAARAAEPADWAKPDIQVMCKEEPLCEQCRAIKVQRARAGWMGRVGMWMLGSLCGWAGGAPRYVATTEDRKLRRQKTGSCVSSADHCLSCLKSGLGCLRALPLEHCLGARRAGVVFLPKPQQLLQLEPD